MRAGQINAETQYVLERFKVEHPMLLSNIGTRVRDMDIRKVPGGEKRYFSEKGMDPDDYAECFHPAYH